MNKIMTRTAQRHAVTDCVSKLWILSPRFNMMNSNIVLGQIYATVLAKMLISFKTSISPFFIKYIVAPLNSISEVLFCICSFCSALLTIGGFIRAVCRTKSTLVCIIRKGIKPIATSFTKFIQTMFCHGIIVSESI